MKDKRGFTLTEIIAVIIILGIILLVAIPITSSMIEDNKKEKYMAYVQLVEQAAYSYADLEVINNGETKVSLKDLVDLKYLKTNNDVEDKYEDINITINKSNGIITIGSVKLKFDGYDCTKDNCEKKTK